MSDADDLETPAAIAALAAIWTPGQVHEVGKVPPSPTFPYCIVSVDSGLPRTRRHGSSGSSRFFRLSVQSVGRSATEARFAARKATAAFLDKRLSVTGYTATPCREETPADVQRDPDAGVLMYALQTFTFTTTPAREGIA